MRSLLRLIPAGLLGVGAAVLVSCGSSGKGLIPLAYAGPLQNDFQAVLQAAREGDGSCAATNAKIDKTEHDLQALPATVDGGLRGRLAEGVANLTVRARTMCTQPLTPLTTTTATTPTSPPSTSTTPSATTSGPSATTPTTGTVPAPTTSQPSGEGGATRAPGTGNDEGRGAGEAQPESEQEASGGVEAGEIGAGGASGGTGGGR